MSSKKRHEVRSSRKSAALGTLVGWVMKGITASLRLEVSDLCGIGSPGREIPPVIYILWHNRFFTVPAAWNHLVGYSDPMPDAANVHYTLGGPYFDEYIDCEHSQAWLDERQAMLRVDQRPRSKA